MQRMNRYGFAVFLSLLVFSLSPSHAAEDPIKEIRHLANRVFRTSQDMVVHGSDGHIFEIVSYGKKMLKRAEILLEKVELSDESNFSNKKGKIIASIKGTIEKTKDAVELGEQNKGGMALSAARKASFRARQTRQRLQMIR